MHEPVIVSAVRTPIGKFLGTLTPFSAVDLGAIVVREAVNRAGIEPTQVDEIIMGNVIQAGLGQNPARQAGLKVVGAPRTAETLKERGNREGTKRRAGPVGLRGSAGSTMKEYGGRLTRTGLGRMLRT